MRISIYALGKWRVYNNKNWNHKVLVDWIFQIRRHTIFSIFVAY